MPCSDVYAVVRVEEGRKVKLEITAKDGVRAFGPALPSTPFTLDESFANFLITKREYYYSKKSAGQHES